MSAKMRVFLSASVMAGALIAAPAVAQAAAVGEPLVPKAHQVDPAFEPAAKKGFDRCPQGYVCLFDKKNGEGRYAYFRYGTSDLRDYSMNNKTTSLWNRSGEKVRLYKGRDSKEYLGYVSPGDKGNLVKRANNNISSLKVVR